MTEMSSLITLVRKLTSPTWGLQFDPGVEGDMICTGEYENYNGAIEMLIFISEIERIAQCERIRKSPVVSVMGDGSTDLGKLHNFVMDVRYLDPVTNVVHTEFVRLSDCPGTARAMTLAFIKMLTDIAPDLVLKLVGGAFDGV